jgi:hypothetical protein
VCELLVGIGTDRLAEKLERTSPGEFEDGVSLVAVLREHPD